MTEFSQTVNESVQRVFSAALLVSSFMVAASLPLVDLAFRRGRLHFSDSEITAVYFSWFSVSLAFWAAQALYARAFYSAGNTFAPMIASSIITIASLPVYAALFQQLSVVGLVVASDLGIAANCLTMAVLLHRRKLVSTNGLDWPEIGKALLISFAATVAAIEAAKFISLQGSRVADVKALAVVTLVWLGVTALGLWITKSKLPGCLRRSNRTIAPRKKATL